VLVLAIDTSTPAVTAGVATLDGDEVTVLGERVTVDPRAHGELLTPHVLEVVGEAGTTLGALDAIVCGVGPGPSSRPRRRPSPPVTARGFMRKPSDCVWSSLTIRHRPDSSRWRERACSPGNVRNP
jgi:hypothetical protein